jgi:hypothetical protein
MRFTGDGKSPLVAERTAYEIVLDLVKLADGWRTLCKQFTADGSDAIRFALTADLKYCAFSIPQFSSVLERSARSVRRENQFLTAVLDSTPSELARAGTDLRDLVRGRPPS